MNASSFTVVYDANVLYPSFLRDVLMRLATTDLFRARWSEDIHREWMEAVWRTKPELDLEKIRKPMDEHVRDCLVTGYQSLISSLELPDPENRHVLAAAIKAQAELIITLEHQGIPSGSSPTLWHQNPRPGRIHPRLA